ncbi:hypothetical protein [Actinomyces sp. ZJ308]|uniref:hypothetical protein n=1 Tax=Actinomyces sp. ZJ308 TaxID=2708342 RepID=UPI0032658B11
MPLLTGNEVVSDAGATTDCHPAASLNYPEGQSKPEYVVPVYETGFGVGIDAVLTGWCHDGGRMLSDPTVTVNVIDGGTVSSYLIPRFKVELDPEIGGGEQSAFVPTELLVKAVRDATGDAAWEVGSRLFSLTYTSGTVSATTGMFSFVKQDPDVVNPSSPEPTPEPTSEPTTGPTQEPSAEPTRDPTAEPTSDPTAEPSQEPTEEPSPTPSPSPEPTATAAPTESARPDPAPTPSAGPTPTPTNETCLPKPTVTVLNPDGSDPRNSDPAYQPEHSIRVSGSGWCENGAAIDGDRAIEVKLVVYSGYVIPRTASVPVTFSNGAFSAQLALSSLYAGTDLATNRYYLQISPIGSAQSGVTNIFSYEAPTTPEPTPTPTAAPTPTPTQKPTAEPSAPAPASPSPTQSADPAPVPSPSPSTEPGPEPSASSAPPAEPSISPSAQSTQPARPAPTSDPATSSPDGADPGTPNTQPDAGNAGGNSSGGGGARNASGTGTSETGSSPAGVPAQSEGDRTRTRSSGRGDDSAPNDSQDSESSAQASAEASPSEDRTVRPDRSPVPPVTSSAQLSADNAGSLSGSRQGNIVNLVLPKAKVSAGEWVSVFVFPGATTKGWVQVDEANSVSIDISTLESGSYELAVADRDNSLLGWAKLEITSASFDPRSPAQAQLLTFPDKDAPASMGLSANDVLLGGAGGLLTIGAGSLLVAARSGLPLRAPRVPRRLRMPRRH